MTGLTSSFNQSIIKNRLKMMNKIKSSNKAIIKYLMVFPVVFFVGIIFAISQEKIDDSIVEVFTISSNGEIIKGTSDFAVIDLSENQKTSFKANNVYTENGEDLYMEGEVSVISEKNTWTLSADNIVYREKERKLYAFTDDYVPSLSPIDVTEYKKITSGFGMRMHPVLKKEMMHNGVDFSADTGTLIMSTANGTVRSAEYANAYGNRVIIDHGSGFSTSYNQMEKYIVEGGQKVKKGEVIGYVGSTGLSTGPHLHYEVMKDGKYVDPADYIGQIME
jgi:murein DD-endopeptidase MepM/ murein hydrolase activator NlpD